MIYLFCSQLFDSLLIYKSVTIYSYMVILNFLTLLKLGFIGITINFSSDIIRFQAMAFLVFLLSGTYVLKKKASIMCCGQGTKYR